MHWGLYSYLSVFLTIKFWWLFLCQTVCMCVSLSTPRVSISHITGLIVRLPNNGHRVVLILGLKDELMNVSSEIWPCLTLDYRVQETKRPSCWRVWLQHRVSEHLSSCGHLCMHACVPAHMGLCAHVYTCDCVHACAHMCMHMNVCICMYAYEGA